MALSKITTASLSDNAVTTAKITDANITTAKIADSNVTTAKIADTAITTAKITDANITTAKVADDAVTNAKVGDDIAVGKFLNKITVSNVASATISSSIITDDYDYYDVIIDSLKPYSSTGRFFYLRMGVEGTTGVETGFVYGQILQQYSFNRGVTFANSSFFDHTHDRILLQALSGATGVGNIPSNTYNAHLRFHNLRIASRRKAVTAINSHVSSTANYNNIYNEVGFHGVLDNTSNKVDEIQITLDGDNLGSGTISTYGIKL